jgi:limonene-1,2-epoxide hydrolase
VTPEEFPNLFAEGWLLPKPEPFLDYFLPLIDREATFTQPMFPAAQGHDQIATLFRQLFALFPDMTAIPSRTAVQDDIVFIESACTATLGRKPVQFSVCDRFQIKDGKLIERASYSDSLPIVLMTLRRPSAWPRALKARR